MIEESKSAILFSAPFGVGKEIIQAIGANDTDIIEYGLANSTAEIGSTMEASAALNTTLARCR